jgi:hypothetical protein
MNRPAEIAGTQHPAPAGIAASVSTDLASSLKSLKIFKPSDWHALRKA